VSDRVGAGHDLVVPVAPQFIFPCGDVDALANTLKDALTDRTRLQLVAGTALAHIPHIQTWLPERNISATLDAIRIAVTRARGSTDKEGVSSQVIPKKSAARPRRQR
jgi:hypothetical protein